MRFTALLHHVTIDRLREAYQAISPNAAPGGRRCDVAGLRVRSRSEPSGSARPGSSRGVPGDADSQGVHPEARWAAAAARGRVVEGQILQRAVAEVLNAIYETDFLGFSYGFRPGRGAHDALDALTVGIVRRKVNWVLDADISDFFSSP